MTNLEVLNKMRDEYIAKENEYKKQKMTKSQNLHYRYITALKEYLPKEAHEFIVMEHSENELIDEMINKIAMTIIIPEHEKIYAYVDYDYKTDKCCVSKDQKFYTVVKNMVTHFEGLVEVMATAHREWKRLQERELSKVSEKFPSVGERLEVLIHEIIDDRLFENKQN